MGVVERPETMSTSQDDESSISLASTTEHDLQHNRSMATSGSKETNNEILVMESENENTRAVIEEEGALGRNGGDDTGVSSTNTQGNEPTTIATDNKQSYLVCQRCSKKKLCSSGHDQLGQGNISATSVTNLPQHVTLSLHRVHSGGSSKTGGNSSVSSGGGGGIGMQTLQPSAVFAQPVHTQSGGGSLGIGGTASHTGSYILLGSNGGGGAGSTAFNSLQSRLGGAGHHPSSSASQSPSVGGGGGGGHLSPHQQSQNNLQFNRGASPLSTTRKFQQQQQQHTLMDSFVDVGTGSHLQSQMGLGGLGTRPGTTGGHMSAGGHGGPISQLVNVCTQEHVEKLNHVKDLLDKFRESTDGENSKDHQGEGGGGSGSGGDGGVVGGERVEEKFLCGDCALLLQEEMERMIAECEMDCQAYQQALIKLEKEASHDNSAATGHGNNIHNNMGTPMGGGSKDSSLASQFLPLSEEDFEREIAKYKEEEHKEERKIAELEKKLKQLNGEQEDLDQQVQDLDKLEQHYWKQFNHYKLELDAFTEEKHALVSKIEGAHAQLELLKRTNIYNDVFHIWHDGPFGTINSFRMGKTNKIQVEWDEINAAWGQAVLLLHTMASSCDEFEFSENKLIPMGSYPKVSDGKNTYELYGPVTQFLRANYDKAMCIFLQCLQEFAVYAKQYDIAHQTKPPFQLPYKIEGDKICGHTVRLRFNVNDKWTKALKYLLANLKVTLVWLTSSGPLAKQQQQQQNQQPQSP